MYEMKSGYNEIPVIPAKAPSFGINEMKPYAPFFGKDTYDTIKEKKGTEESEMSFVGALCTVDGLIAFADTKSTINNQNKMSEEIGREAKKIFPYRNGILLTYGSNEVFDRKKRHYFLEELLDDFFDHWKGSDLKHELFHFLLKKGAFFFQEQSFYFIDLKKENGAYRQESFRIDDAGYQSDVYRYLQRNHMCFGGADCYKLLFQTINVSRITNGEDGLEGAENRLRQCLEDAIWFFDEWLEYNPVGGKIITRLL